MFPFEQTRLSNARQIACLIRQGRVMTVPNNYKDYARYAEHCLKIVTAITDQESRRIQREMATNGEDLRMQFANHVGSSKCKWNDAGRLRTKRGRLR